MVMCAGRTWSCGLSKISATGIAPLLMTSCNVVVFIAKLLAGREFVKNIDTVFAIFRFN